ncbi:hypothetical protein [Parasphingorhabdus pacifica]
MESVHGSHLNGATKDLLEPAWQLRWRVPELALMLSDRVVAQARAAGDRSLRLRAEALALFASNRLGQGATATHRAIVAVRDAESAADDEMVARLRVLLAACARSASSHDAAMRVLDPVLERERIDPAVRANALLEMASVLPSRRRDGEGFEALEEADRLFLSSDLDRQDGKLWRARVAVARACYFRRNGDFTSAVRAADSGLALLAGLDPEADGGGLTAQLVLERVHALLDLGRRAEAVKAAGAIVGQPVRAAAAAPSGWLRLALATRVHLPEGEPGVAVWLLNDAAAAAERHNLDGLLAELLRSISQTHENAQDFPAALTCLQGACAADRRWQSVVHNARLRLVGEFPGSSTGSVPRGGPAADWPKAAAAGTEPTDAAPVEAAAAGTTGSTTTEPSTAGAPSTGVTATGGTVTGPTATGVTAGGVTVSPAESYADDLPSEPDEPRPRRRRADNIDADTARRLMETLTSRSSQRSEPENEPFSAGQEPSSGRRAMPEPRPPEVREHEVQARVEDSSAPAPTPPPAADAPDQIGADSVGSSVGAEPAADPAAEVAKLLEAIRAETAGAAHESDGSRPSDRPSAGMSPTASPAEDPVGQGNSSRAFEGWPTWDRSPVAGPDAVADQATVPEPAARESAARESAARESAVPDPGAPDPPFDAPDVTTIMPVIPTVDSEDPAPTGGAHSAGNPDRTAAADPLGGDWSGSESPAASRFHRSDSAHGIRDHDFPVFEPMRGGNGDPEPDRDPRHGQHAGPRHDRPRHDASGTHAVPGIGDDGHDPRPGEQPKHSAPDAEFPAQDPLDYRPPTYERGTSGHRESAYPTSAYPASGDSVLGSRPGYPDPGHLVSDYEPSEHPASDHEPAGYPAADYPAADYPAADYLTSAYEPLGHEVAGENPGPADAEGRRSKGKSLAEIRAGLRLVEGRGSQEPAEQQASEEGGRRRARHADPDDEPEPISAGSEPAGDLLARYGQWAREESTAPAPEPEPEPEVPADVGLADLLAEALMAYQNGRGDDADSANREATTGTGGRRRAVPDGPEPAAHSRHAQPSTSDAEAASARHRRAAVDSGGFKRWSQPGH